VTRTCGPTMLRIDKLVGKTPTILGIPALEWMHGVTGGLFRVEFLV
jgi:hypothetical protein